MNYSIKILISGTSITYFLLQIQRKKETTYRVPKEIVFSLKQNVAMTIMPTGISSNPCSFTAAALGFGYHHGYIVRSDYARAASLNANNSHQFEDDAI